MRVRTPPTPHLLRGWLGVGHLPGRAAGRWGRGFRAGESWPAWRRSEGQGSSGWTPGTPGKGSVHTAQMRTSSHGGHGRQERSALQSLWSHWLLISYREERMTWTSARPASPRPHALRPFPPTFSPQKGQATGGFFCRTFPFSLNLLLVTAQPSDTMPRKPDQASPLDKST